MKIAATTFYTETHPSAALYAYALSRTLSSFRKDVKLIADEREELPQAGSALKRGILKVVTDERETLADVTAKSQRLLLRTM
jgi:hypothetical protein